MPARSISDSTGTSGRSSVSYTAMRRSATRRGFRSACRRRAMSALLGGVARGVGDRHLFVGELVAALAENIGERDRLVAEIFFRKLVEPMAVSAAIEHIRHQHHVVARRKRKPATRKQRVGEFDVVADLERRVVFDQRLQDRERVLFGELRRCPRPARAPPPRWCPSGTYAARPGASASAMPAISAGHGIAGTGFERNAPRRRACAPRPPIFPASSRRRWSCRAP